MNEIIQNNNPFIGKSFSNLQRVRRLFWNIVWRSLFYTSPKIMHTWRNFILRTFGAEIGNHVHIDPSVKIWAPWNLKVGNYVGVGEGAKLYNMASISIGDYSVVSQGAYLCTGSHDYNSKNFQLIALPINIEKSVWLCTEVFLSPGVTVVTGCVVAPRSVVSRDLLEPWTVWAGVPARQVGTRNRVDFGLL